MKNCSTTAIVLGHKNLGEKDKFVFLYTKILGKTRVIAKGSRRLTSKFTGHLETLNTVKTSLYFGPKNTILTEISTEKCYPKIWCNLDKLKSSLIIAEITEKMLYEGQKIKDLIPLIEKTVNQLTITEKPKIITAGYIIKLLDQIGLIPDFKKIKTTLDEKYLKFFHFAKSCELSQLEKIKLSHQEQSLINQSLQKLIELQTEREMKSLKI